MKRLFLILFLTMALTGCGNSTDVTENVEESTEETTEANYDISQEEAEFREYILGTWKDNNNGVYRFRDDFTFDITANDENISGTYSVAAEGSKAALAIAVTTEDVRAYSLEFKNNNKSVTLDDKNGTVIELTKSGN